MKTFKGKVKTDKGITLEYPEFPSVNFISAVARLLDTIESSAETQGTIIKEIIINEV